MSKKKHIRTVAAPMAEKKQLPSGVYPNADVMKIANEARSKANALPDEKREEAFEFGMRLIYGGNSHVATKVSGS